MRNQNQPQGLNLIFLCLIKEAIGLLKDVLRWVFCKRGGKSNDARVKWEKLIPFSNAISSD